MERKSEHPAETANKRAARKRVTVCSPEYWRDLVKPSPKDTRIVAGSEEKADPGVSIPATEEILFALALAVEQRDRDTAGHCERLALVSVSLGMAMGLDVQSLLTLYRGGYLHDIGKVGIPDSILFKPAKLTAEEWVTMRSHTTRGEEICRPLKSLKPVLPLIRHHHERWDGSGYPDGLRGDQIPILARILQIADIYDALTSPRPYKRALSIPDALDTIRRETDRGWRDPAIVALFLRMHEEVISKVAEYGLGADRNLRAMQQSLSGLQQFLGLTFANTPTC
jgi:response regulator RpfG family c-di-GMP phosphodiesterase